MRNIFIVLTIILFISCNLGKPTNQEMTSIIKLSVDSINVKFRDPFSKKILIDFSKVKSIDKSSINDFLKSKTNYTLINSDSLLRIDSIWTKYGYLENYLLRFEDLSFKNDSIILNIDKIKATDGSRGIEIKIIKNSKNEYKIVSCKTTWIS